MAENLYLDLAITVACERYNLDEHVWVLFTFTDGSKAITIGLENIETGAKIRASFPREDIRFEEMKRWSDEKKLAFVQGMLANGHELPEELVDAYHHIMLKVEVPVKPNEEDSIIVEDTEATESVEETETVEEPEETEKEFTQKVGKKIGKKFKRKEVTA